MKKFANSAAALLVAGALSNEASAQTRPAPAAENTNINYVINNSNRNETIEDVSGPTRGTFSILIEGSDTVYHENIRREFKDTESCLSHARATIMERPAISEVSASCRNIKTNALVGETTCKPSGYSEIACSFKFNRETAMSKPNVTLGTFELYESKDFNRTQLKEKLSEKFPSRDLCARRASDLASEKIALVTGVCIDKKTKDTVSRETCVHSGGNTTICVPKM